MQPMKRHYLPLIAAVALAACGGGGAGGNGASGPTPSAPPARGTLLQTPPELLSTFTISALLTELELPVNPLLLSVSSAPLCDIVFYHIQYATVGGTGEATTASAVLMIPTGLGANCSGDRPDRFVRSRHHHRSRLQHGEFAKCRNDFSGCIVRLAGLRRGGTELRGL